MEAKGSKIGGTVFREDSVDPLKGSGAGTALAVGGQNFYYWNWPVFGSKLPRGRGTADQVQCWNY